MKKINLMSIKYKDLKLEQREAVKIRGYFANEFESIEAMHNHKQNNFIYKYPSIQYKVIDNNPMILGIEQGVDILNKNNIPFIEQIKISEEIVSVNDIEINYSKQYFGISESYIEYEFLSPWIALNQNNIKSYIENDYEGKMETLTRILIGNILSCSKSLGYTVENEISVGLDIYETSINFKNKKMRAFKGKFITNFEMPDYIGLGKSCSKGYGTIKKL